MKKILISIFSFILMFVISFGSVTPVLAITASSETEILSQKTTSYDLYDIPISERYHIIENGYLDKYDLQEGIFAHQPSQQMILPFADSEKENKYSVYFYSDGYFADAPEIYNPSLSTMSFSLAFSAFNAGRNDFDTNLPSGEYSNLFRNVKLLLSDIGIKEEDIYINHGYSNRPTEDTIGMIMGAKEISIDNEDYILVPIAVRGGDYEAEWASNFDLGESGESHGFSSASTQVIEQIEKYIESNSSFDLSSALNEGKVKFWIVGYSRGSSVANITAKRLTDVYGKSGNSIYSYCFEVPGGGVDSAEIHEPWTYNGVYANIHNIINKADLVPNVPPKQMGFKRYGVDHYLPGTDAGEITQHSYTTPSGVTVTTYADNVPYVIQGDVYNEKRSEMLWHLNNIDSTIKFSDSFSLVTVNIRKAISNGNIFSGNIFEEIKTDDNITSAEWIEYLVSDLQSWVANGTYVNGKLQNGGYNHDYRKFYTTNTEFAGKEYVTPEVALRCVLRLVFTHYENEEFMNALMYRGLSFLLKDFNIFDLYSNVIQKWDRLSKAKQTEYLDEIWNCLNADLNHSDGTPVKKITDFVDPDERELLEKSVYTLSSFLFLFISKDNQSNPGIDGANKTLVHISTLIYNVTTIGQGHYPEICLAWLRTFDDNYSEDNPNAKFIDREVKLTNNNNALPEIEAKIDIEETKTSVSLLATFKSNSGIDASSNSNGASIYYAIYENGIMATDWQLYRAPIVLDTTKSTQYSIKALATRLETMGTELEIESNLLQNTTGELPNNNLDNEFNDSTDENPIDKDNEIIVEKDDETPSQKTDNKITSVVLILSGSILIAISIVYIKKRYRNRK